MNLLKSRKFAILLTALVVIFSVLFGPHRSLTAVRNEAVDVFQNGTAGDGHSVANDLRVCRDTAANLYTVAVKYLDADSPALAALSSARAVSQSDAYRNAASAARDLREAANMVFTELEAQPVAGQDTQYLAGFRAELDSRTFAIQSDPYNDLAETFNTKTLASFPVSLLRPVLFVDELPVYR